MELKHTFRSDGGKEARMLGGGVTVRMISSLRVRPEVRSGWQVAIRNATAPRLALRSMRSQSVEHPWPGDGAESGLEACRQYVTVQTYEYWSGIPDLRMSGRHVNTMFHTRSSLFAGSLKDQMRLAVLRCLRESISTIVGSETMLMIAYIRTVGGGSARIIKASSPTRLKG